MIAGKDGAEYGPHRASWALQLAAQAWGTPKTSHSVMDRHLAEAFAEILERDCAPWEKLVAELEEENERLKVELGRWSWAAHEMENQAAEERYHAALDPLEDILERYDNEHDKVIA